MHLWQRQNWQQIWVHTDILSCIISRSSLVKMLLFKLEYWRVPCSCTDAFWPPCSQHLMSRLTLTLSLHMQFEATRFQSWLTSLFQLNFYESCMQSIYSLAGGVNSCKVEQERHQIGKVEKKVTKKLAWWLCKKGATFRINGNEIEICENLEWIFEFT